MSVHERLCLSVVARAKVYMRACVCFWVCECVCCCSYPINTYYTRPKEHRESVLL